MRQQRRWRWAHSTAGGFTLVELLIVAALGSLALGVVALVLTRSIRTSVNTELNQQALNELGRIAAFIELEVGEAAAETGVAAIRSTGVANPCGQTGTPAFSLTLPNPGGTSRIIQYYTTGAGAATTLWRCGPPVNNDGTLNYGANPVFFPLGFNVTVSNVQVNARGESVTYRLSIVDSGLPQARELTSTVRSRSPQVN